MKIIGDGGHARVIRSFYHGQGDIVAIGDNATRKRVVEENVRNGWWTNDAAIHPSAIIAENVPIGVGTVIMAGAIIQPGCLIGQFCIVNSGALLDHDCIIGDYAHIAPGAHLCGHVEVGEGALVGVGVGIAPMCKIPAWSLVKARRLEIVPLSNNG